MDVALYLRISLDRDGKEAGVDRQREDCTRLCEQLGWNIVAEYVDNNVSASRFGRKVRAQYLEMLTSIEASQVQAIVMWDPDRLLRQPKELEALIDLVEGRSLEIRACMAGKLDLETANGRLIARMLVAVAAHESEHKSERVKRKMRQKRENGDPHAGGLRTMGYTVGGRELVPDEVTLVREAVRRALAGEKVAHILIDWTNRGIRPTSGGKHWSGSNFKRLLVSPKIAGLQPDGSTPGAWPTIIDADTHARLKAVLVIRQSPGSSPRRFMLTGLLFCGRCGGPMAGSGDSYRCLEPMRGGCGRLSVRAAAADEHVARMALPAVPGQQRVEGGAQDEVELLLKALGEIEADIAQLAKDHYVEKRIGRPAYMAANDELEQRAARLRDQIADQQTGQDLGSLDDIVESWDHQSVSWRQAVLKTVLNRVECAPACSTRQPAGARLRLFWKA